MTHTSEVADKARFLFEGQRPSYDEASVHKNIDKEGTLPLLDAAIEALSAIGEDQWHAAQIDAALEPLPERLEVGKRRLFQAVRVAECGNQVSPPLSESMELLGRAVSLGRLEAAKELVTL